jgi:hypothetical protein
MPPGILKRKKRHAGDIAVAISIAIAGGVVIGVLVELWFKYFESLLGDPHKSSWKLKAFAVSGVTLALLGAAYALLRLAGAPRYLFDPLLIRAWNGVKTNGAYTFLVWQWQKFVMRGPRPELVRIRAAIARGYLKQEIRDLSGKSDLRMRTWTRRALEKWVKGGRPKPEPRPLIVTNFVRYAGLVEAAITGAMRALEKSGRTDARVLCVTTLTMPLAKWLNFDQRTNSHADWDRYLEFLRTEALNRPNLIVARIVLIQDDATQPAAGVDPNHSMLEMLARRQIEIPTESDFREEMRHWVWEKFDDGARHSDPASYRLTPLKPKQWPLLIGDLWPAKSLDPTRVRPDRRAYIVLDGAQFDAEPVARDPRAGRFRRLGDAFIERFHSERSDGSRHAYFVRVKATDYLPKDDHWPPKPLDCFYVGWVTPRSGAEEPAATKTAVKSGQDGSEFDDLNNLEHEGLFAFSAKPDNDLHMVYLSLMDPEVSPKNFPRLEEYVRDLLSNARSLSELGP